MIGAVVGLLIALKKVTKDKDNLGLSKAFYVYGAFVWADMVIFGVFWTLFSLFIGLISSFQPLRGMITKFFRLQNSSTTMTTPIGL